MKKILQVLPTAQVRNHVTDISPEFKVLLVGYHPSLYFTARKPEWLWYSHKATQNVKPISAEVRFLRGEMAQSSISQWHHQKAVITSHWCLRAASAYGVQKGILMEKPLNLTVMQIMFFFKRSHQNQCMCKESRILTWSLYLSVLQLRGESSELSVTM